MVTSLCHFRSFIVGDTLYIITWNIKPVILSQKTLTVHFMGLVYAFTTVLLIYTYKKNREGIKNQ